jgi:ABC-type transporter Mla subunit MlaD
MSGESTSARLRQVQADLAASQQDLTRVERERDAVREELARQAEANEDLTVTLAVRTGMLRRAREDCDAISAIAHRVALAAGVTSLRLDDVRRGVDELLAEVEQRRTALAGVLAELRELAAANRADAARFAGTSSPYGFGPTRAAEAYEKAAALVAQIHNPDREEPTNG